MYFTDISIQKDCSSVHTIEIPALNNFNKEIEGNFHISNDINEILKKNSKLYVSINGTKPPNNIIVDIYIKENSSDKTIEPNEQPTLNTK